MQQLCRPILGAGRQCAAVAPRGKNFCFHHNHLHIEKRSSGLRSQITLQPPTQTYEPRHYPSTEWPRLRAHFAAPHHPRIPGRLRLHPHEHLPRHQPPLGGTHRPPHRQFSHLRMQVCLSALNGKALVEPARAPQSHSRSNDDDSDSTDNSGCPRSGFSDLGSRPVSCVILTPD